MKILVTGGAGYIGSTLVTLLLNKGYEVVIIDKLASGGESILHCISDDRVTFYKGDVRDRDNLEKIFTSHGIDGVVHLAAIVGDPACAKDPELSRTTNFDGTKNVFEFADKFNVQKFIFSSTCSNYGKMSDPKSYVHEDSDLSPVSLYAETKVEVEQFLFSMKGKSKCKPTSLRFSTVYGISPRARFDLTVNEFTKELSLGREVQIFGEQFWRPYCHVRDLARSVIITLEAPVEKVEYNVFNVGDTDENYTKKMLIEEITKVVPDVDKLVSYVKKNEDPRDYRVSFSKIRDELGFSITKRVPDGIKEIHQIIQDGFLDNPDAPRYKNV